jgi:hypothetical protein
MKKLQNSLSFEALKMGHAEMLSDTFDFVLVPPHDLPLPCRRAGRRYDLAELRKDIQKLRGRVYIQDGAISADELDEAGRHLFCGENTRWYVAVVEMNSGTLLAANGYSAHFQPAKALHGTHVRHILERAPVEQAQALIREYESVVKNCLQLGHGFGEGAGWIASPGIQALNSGILAALAGPALFNCIGVRVSMCVATQRHSANAILKRIGMRPLLGDVTSSVFDDPTYGCRMEALAFTQENLTNGFHRVVIHIGRVLEEQIASFSDEVCGIIPGDWHLRDKTKQNTLGSLSVA